MATPATAAHLLQVESTHDLVDGLRFARANKLTAMPLGEGSNTVFKGDYQGLLLVLKSQGVDIVSDLDDKTVLRVAAGENWHKLVASTMDQGLYGLENLALIPGSVGAAPIQNIGAYGVEVSRCIEAVEYLDTESLEVVRMTNADCQFGYRDSVFKHSLRHTAIVTAVEFKLDKQPAVNLSYAALQQYFSDQEASPQDVFNAVCEIRSSKLPLPSDIPNCGSFFKNPVVSHNELRNLQQDFPDIVYFPFQNGVKLAAAWLIDHAGWKDKSLNGVRVHSKQALVITNPQHRSGEVVCEFAKAIQYDVQKRYGVCLEIEPKIV